MAVAMSAKEHNEQLLKKLKKGDLIEFPHVVYSHWAVYVGNGEVVHLTDNDGKFTLSLSSNGSKGIVKKEKFWVVVGDTLAKRNNDKDVRYVPLPPDEIVGIAMAAVGKVGYNLLEQNCEHFASFCRYGEKISDQADYAKFISNFIIPLKLATEIISHAT